MIACHSLISRRAPLPAPVATLLLSIVPAGASAGLHFRCQHGPFARGVGLRRGGLLN
jgi:hypothetical protein